jgi:hypothetical protein
MVATRPFFPVVTAIGWSVVTMVVDVIYARW